VKTKILLSCSLLLLVANAAWAADSPWVGTWKLDPAKSQLAGDTFTYSKGPGALLHFSDGVVAYDFGTDGKEYKAAYDRSVKWTQTGPNSWDSVVTRNGKVLGKTQHTLSADGKTLTVHYTGTRADGAPFDDQDVYTRTSGGDGLLGSWKSVKVGTSGGPQTFIISSPAPGILHYDVPELRAHTEGPLDGTDRPLVGGNTPDGMTISLKLLSPTTIKYVMKVNGKEDNEGVQTLAADARSYTDVSWSPGKETEKQTSIFVKQ
jgi:hypothetical protein